jgi:hypothetical protein
MEITNEIEMYPLYSDDGDSCGVASSEGVIF